MSIERRVNEADKDVLMSPDHTNPSHLTCSLVCDAAHDPLDPLHPDLELHGPLGEAGVLRGHCSLLTVLWWLLPV